jgi:apolipoprotein N-acyltransferase
MSLTSWIRSPEAGLHNTPPPFGGPLRLWLLPVLAGLAFCLAFPGGPGDPFSFLRYGLWAAAAFVPLLVALQGCSFKSGFRCGWITGFVFNLYSLYWVAYTQGGGPAVIGGTVLMAAYLGLFTGLFAGSLAAAQRCLGRRALLAAPVFWTAQEYLFSLGELGFPWLLLGHALAVYPIFIQHAAYTGVYGVSFWAAAMGTALFVLLDQPHKPWRPGAALGLGLVLPALYGLAVLPADPKDGPTLRVGLVQNNIGLEKWQAGGRERSLASLERLSRQAHTEKADLLVWPETALPCYVERDGACRQRVQDLVKDLQTPVLAGAPAFDKASGEPNNSAFLFRPDVDSLQSYAKMHLVPFGERTPFRDAVPLLRDIDWTALTGDLGPAEFAQGTHRTLFDQPKAPFAVLICFESVFPDLVRQSVRQGARLLVNITNDSWFGSTAGPYQHAQLAVLRAVENRTAVARCATSGVSLFIDPYGRTYRPTRLFSEAAIVDDVAIGSGGTFYTRHGDLFAQANGGIALAFLILTRRRNGAASTKAA